MIEKKIEKENAIELRKQGFSYNEILKQIPVAKSTLSVWLREVGLSKKQNQRLTLKRKSAQIKACKACRQIRLKKQTSIIASAASEIGSFSLREFWIAGILLYWAEGAKQKESNVSQRVSFSNSDPKMILLFDKWLKKFCNVNQKDIVYGIYIHKTADSGKSKKFWEKILNEKINGLYFKKHNPKTHKKNYANYNGLIKLDVRRSTDLNRKIKGWILGITNNLKIHTGE
jgi:hypothetical protein